MADDKPVFVSVVLSDRMRPRDSVLDFIGWAEWYLCGRSWTPAARRWRYSRGFTVNPAERDIVTYGPGWPD